MIVYDRDWRRRSQSDGFDGGAEHQAIKELLSSLENTAIDAPEFDARIFRLEREVSHHVKEEEGEMFPELRQKLSTDRLIEMCERLEKAKATAPTHPHPHAPNKPPMNKIAGTVSAAADEVRDAVSERKR